MFLAAVGELHDPTYIWLISLNLVNEKNVNIDFFFSLQQKVIIIEEFF